MLTTQQRAEILAEAKTWIGTPYRGWSCLKGCGTDCGQFLYGVYRAVGLIPEFELPKDYSLQVSLHRASTEYIDLVDKYFRQIPEGEAQPGDLVVYKIGKGFAHAAIIVEWPHYVLQADDHNGVAGAHGTDTPIFRRAERQFRTLRAEYCGGM